MIYSKFFAESSVSEISKETIADFKRINIFSISICQNKEDKSSNILVYLIALTKKNFTFFLALQKSQFTLNFPQNLRFQISLKIFDNIFLALQKNRFNQNFPQNLWFLEVSKETIAAFKRFNRFSISICQNKEDKNTKILVYLVALTKNFDKIFLALQKSRFTQNTLLQHYVTLMQH